MIILARKKTKTFSKIFISSINLLLRLFLNLIMKIIINEFKVKDHYFFAAQFEIV
jgi:hypothetical protein